MLVEAREKLLNILTPKLRKNEKIINYYLSVFLWINEINEKKESKKISIIGINGPQGVGKTTLSSYLCQLFQSFGKKSISISIDDFYYPFNVQKKIAEKYSLNPLLQYRGNPGTHDIILLLNLLQKCLNESKIIKIPRYDKSANSGRGDRLKEFEEVKGPLDIILLEGWCLGFEHIKKENCLNDDLYPINEALIEYEKINKLLDGMLIIEIKNIEWIYKWREEAEDKMKKKGKNGLNKIQMKDFIDRFIPTYKLYLPILYQEKEKRNIPIFQIKLDENRGVINI